MNPQASPPPKKAKLSNLRAFSPANSITSRQHVHVYAYILADSDIALVIPRKQKKHDVEPFTYPAVKALKDRIGPTATDPNNVLIKIGFFATASILKSSETDEPIKKEGGYEFKGFVARGRNYHKHPEDLEKLCNTFVNVSFFLQ